MLAQSELRLAAAGVLSVPARAGKGERMFGLSLSKILFTILIAVVVWKGFALVSRLARERQQQPRPVRQGSQGRPRGTAQRTIELVECERCGAYVDPSKGCRCEQARG
jgi:hypothetical protein